MVLLEELETKTKASLHRINSVLMLSGSVCGSADGWGRGGGGG